MCNSLLISSDYKSLFLIGKRDEDRLFINGNGILLSVLGNSITGCEVPAQLRTHVTDLTKEQKPFFEMDVTDTKDNHVSVSYSEENSAVFIIGVIDIDGSLQVDEPTEIDAAKIRAKVVKLKDSNIAGLASKKAIYIKTEITAAASIPGKNNNRGSSIKKLRFYLLDAHSMPNS
ncbi:MAG: hypothetical protein ACI9XO_003975 [Paraglaciecola sp.]|jgi:hypothetical protein